MGLSKPQSATLYLVDTAGGARPMNADPNRIRCIDPLVSPQYPFDETPRTPEQSQPRYASVADYEAIIPLRDGVRLAADVIRPHAGGLKFPALVTTSVYTRQLQRS